MTAFSDHTSLSQHENYTDQIKELQEAIQENGRKLVEIKQKRLHAEEEIIKCTRETEQRVDLMMGKIKVVDALQHLGRLLQQERQLSEQLNAQASAERDDLQEKREHVTNKLRSLAAEILEVKEQLAEAKTRNLAEALIHAPARKSKTKQSKPK
ncbi:myosin-2-like isoform X2 [Centropristis striata]|uniref:myosin-2-like isoform X2 n=1 Tax=Centropristis striata TaxID=184440 RepID=UPI0027DFB935|nr:myosin-2-like isoform X2 [Centropristis striata]